MESHPARRAEVSIIYEGVNISKDVAPYLLGFTYTDNASDKADDISFSLEDRDRLWVDDWFPTKGDKIKVSIIPTIGKLRVRHNHCHAERLRSMKFHAPDRLTR